MTEITVVIQGGMVQGILDIPPDCQVKIVDYDIDCTLDCDKDDQGEPCCISIYCGKQI